MAPSSILHANKLLKHIPELAKIPPELAKIGSISRTLAHYTKDPKFDACLEYFFLAQSKNQKTFDHF